MCVVRCVADLGIACCLQEDLRGKAGQAITGCFARLGLESGEKAMTLMHQAKKGYLLDDSGRPMQGEFVEVKVPCKKKGYVDLVPAVVLHDIRAAWSIMWRHSDSALLWYVIAWGSCLRMCDPWVSSRMTHS